MEKNFINVGEESGFARYGAVIQHCSGSWDKKIVSLSLSQTKTNWIWSLTYRCCINDADDRKDTALHDRTTFYMGLQNLMLRYLYPHVLVKGKH
jgi:hypothetical protein